MNRTGSLLVVLWYGLWLLVILHQYIERTSLPQNLCDIVPVQRVSLIDTILSKPESSYCYPVSKLYYIERCFHHKRLSNGVVNVLRNETNNSAGILFTSLCNMFGFLFQTSSLCNTIAWKNVLPVEYSSCTFYRPLWTFLHWFRVWYSEKLLKYTKMVCKLHFQRRSEKSSW